MQNEQKSPFGFRERLKSRENMFGTFLKLPTMHAVEILSVVGFDFVIIDEEHAPFDRSQTDHIIMAARANGVVPLVRIGEFTDANILSVLDCGACGVMVPHVDSVEKAKRVADACRYTGGKSNGTRGFGSFSRASGWGRLNKLELVANQDSQNACIAMIEDLHAVDIAEDIASVDGIDALFIGQGDLGSALGDVPNVADKVAAIVEKVAAAAKAADVPMLMIPSGPSGVAKARDLGVHALILASDQNFLRTGATATLRAHTEAAEKL